MGSEWRGYPTIEILNHISHFLKNNIVDDTPEYAEKLRKGLI